MWEMGGTGQGRRAGKRGPGRPVSRRGRPHTRRCLDAAITVSSGHPGSAGSAERELNKELREEERSRKAPAEPAPRLWGSFSALRPPFVSTEMPCQARVMRGFGGGRAGCPAGDAFCTCVFLFGGESEQA